MEITVREGLSLIMMVHWKGDVQPLRGPDGQPAQWGRGKRRWKQKKLGLPSHGPERARLGGAPKKSPFPTKIDLGGARSEIKETDRPRKGDLINRSHAPGLRSEKNAVEKRPGMG